MTSLQINYLESVGRLTTPAYAGYACVDNVITSLPGTKKPLPCDSHLYYWYSPYTPPPGAKDEDGPPTNVPTKDSPSAAFGKAIPIVLYLGGGARLEESALQGAFTSILPYIFSSTKEAEVADVIEVRNLEANTRAWTRRAHVIALDAVLGVGFSFSTSGIRRSSTLQVVNDILRALSVLTRRYPTLQNRRLILAGTGSMAQIIPLVGYTLLVEQGLEPPLPPLVDSSSLPSTTLSYSGALILSGIFDPAIQFKLIPGFLKQVLIF